MREQTAIPGVGVFKSFVDIDAEYLIGSSTMGTLSLPVTTLYFPGFVVPGGQRLLIDQWTVRSPWLHGIAPMTCEFSLGYGRQGQSSVVDYITSVVPRIPTVAVTMFGPGTMIARNLTVPPGLTPIVYVGGVPWAEPNTGQGGVYTTIQGRLFEEISAVSEHHG
jgi:hypothetical protein